MKRKHLHLTERQLAALNLLSRTMGITIAEIVRRAIDEYLTNEMNEIERAKKEGVK